MSDTNPVVEGRLRLLLKHFFNRTDVLCNKPKEPCPIYPTPDQVEDVLRAHLDGRRVKVTARSKHKGTEWAALVVRVGSYAPAPDGTTLWACVDVDGDTHDGRYVKDSLAATLAIMSAFRAAGLSCHLERSKSGAGWHVWVFFGRHRPAKDVRRVLLALIPTDLPLGDGGFANASRNAGVELFPKRDDLNTAGGIGSQVWLPWYHGAAEGCNQFHRLDSSGVPTVYEPVEFETVDEEAFAAVLARLDAEAAKAEAETSSPVRGRATSNRSGAKTPGGAWWKPIADDYDQNGPKWGEILDGWTDLGGGLWRRPDKKEGTSATTGVCSSGEADLLHVFSSNAAPFEADGSYGRFRAYSLLNHGGDHGLAAEELKAQGYGPKEEAKDDNKQKTPKPKPDPNPPPKITSGPAAVKTFDCGLDLDMALGECPDAGTMTVIRKDGQPVVISTRCGRCRACRHAVAADYVGRAAEGIGRDLEAGCQLAVFDGEAEATAMSSRMKKCKDQLRYRDGTFWLVVASLEPGSKPPCGFASATPAEVKAVLHKMYDEAVGGENPFTQQGRRRRPFALSNGWRWPPRRPKSPVSAIDESDSSSANRVSGTVLRLHGRRSLRAITEALRGLDFDTHLPPDPRRTFFDPLLKRNPRFGRVQWVLVWNPIRPLTGGEVLEVLAVLDDLPSDDLPPERDERTQ